MAQINVKGRQIGYKIWHEQQPITLVLLHGFTGSAQGWEQIAKQFDQFRVLAIDMVGHGESDAPIKSSEYEMAVQIELIKEVLEELQLEQVYLLGYSMGGRIALSFACAYPNYVKALFLESATAGIEKEDLRKERRASDERLAEKIEREGVESFVQHWENIPLFESHKMLPTSVQNKLRQERLSQRVIGLANSLRGIGTGKMPSVWSQLKNLDMPVYLMAGEKDEKFIQLNRKMQTIIANAVFLVIPCVGHTIHVENPSYFVKIVKDKILILEEEQ